jgi:phosphoribosylanthranilate isomerase
MQEVDMHVKICGITKVEDARLAEDAGADAIGFIFVPNTKRFVSTALANSISRSLGPFIGKIGVFRDASLEEILETLEVVRLTAVQLHGNRADAVAEEVSRHVAVIRAVSYGDTLPKAETLHIDGLEPGSGQAFDWSALDTGSLEGQRWILAGGLNPENVSAAMNALKPWGVDVSSGVESAPGVKDHAKIEAFVRAVKTASS